LIPPLAMIHIEVSHSQKPTPNPACHSAQTYFALLILDRSELITLFLLYWKSTAHDTPMISSSIPDVHTVTHDQTDRDRFLVHDSLIHDFQNPRERLMVPVSESDIPP